MYVRMILSKSNNDTFQHSLT